MADSKVPPQNIEDKGRSKVKQIISRKMKVHVPWKTERL